MRSFIKLLFLLMLLAGCLQYKSREPHSEKETRPLSRPSPSSGGAFEGAIRYYTHGTQGDALDLDEAPLGDLIAFSWNNNQNQPKIYIIKITKGQPQQPQQVTFGNWPDIEPEFLPTSTPGSYKIAFASLMEGNFNIYTKSISENSGICQITSNQADERHPTFSPNGQYIAFCRLDRDNTWKIWKINLNTQQETLLGPGKNPEWSPTGDTIAFQLPVGRDKLIYSIWTMKIDGSSRTQIVSDPDSSYGATHPSWSPTGKYLAYTRIYINQSIFTKGPPPAGHIWAIEISTGLNLRLTNIEEGLDSDPCWGLNNWIYFSSTRSTGKFNILSRRFKTDSFKLLQ